MDKKLYSGLTIFPKPYSCCEANEDNNLNGPVSWDDLEDLPFGEEVTEGVLTFDGDLTGREVINISENEFFIKMTDYYMSPEMFEGATVTYYYQTDAGGELSSNILENNIDNVQENVPPDGSGRLLTMVYIKNKDEEAVIVSVHGDFSDIGLPVTTGTYFIYREDEYNNKFYTISASCITGEIKTIKTLDEKYLPESVESLTFRSTTEGSEKKFKITVDDSGTITAIEVKGNPA